MSIKRFFRKNNAFSLVEVMVALGVMGFISAGTMQLIKMQTKSQKTINISMEKSNILFRIKNNLLSENGCLGTINTARSGYAVGDISVENCILNGTNLPSVNKINNTGIFINQIVESGEIIGGIGTKIKVDSIKFISSQRLDSTNQGELIDATFCVKLVVQGNQDTSYGQIESIHSFPVNVSSIPPGGTNSDNNPESIDSCNSDQTNYIAGNCEALGGKLGDQFKCNGINIKAKSPASSTNFSIVENSAINAIGNAGVNENLIVCGNMSIGDNKFNIKERLGVNTNCGPSNPGITSGVLTVGNLLDVGKLITSENATFDSRVEIGKDGGGTFIVDGQAEISTGNLNVSNGKIFTNDLTVKNKAYIKGDIQAKKAILKEEVTAGDITIHSNYINSPKSLNIETNELTVYGKIKAIQNGVTSDKYNGDEIYASPNPDYLATESWVRSIVLSTMPDSAKQDLIRALTTYAEESGIKSLRRTFFLNNILLESTQDSSIVMGTSTWKECRGANSFINKIVRRYDFDMERVYFDIQCGVYTPDSNTPRNCEWANNVVTGVDSFFGTVKCPVGKIAINTTCQLNGNHKAFEYLRSYGVVHHKFPTGSPCVGSNCLNSNGTFNNNQLLYCQAGSNHPCNGAYCNYSSDADHIVSALCCDM